MWLTTAVLGTLLSYTWIIEPRVQSNFIVVPGVVVLALGFWRAFRSGEWGFERGALIPGLRAAAMFTVPIAVALIVAGAARGTLHDRGDDAASVAALIAWGGAQQWILQTVVLRELQRTASRRAGIPLAAILFAAVHLPNPFLTAMTFLGALGWCAIYDRYPNIIPVALSHAIGTLAILYAFDDRLTGRLRIGRAYLSVMSSQAPQSFFTAL